MDDDQEDLHVELHLVRVTDSDALLAAANSGDVTARQLSYAIAHKVSEEPPHICVVCQHDIDPERGKVDAISLFLSPPEPIAYAGFICARCAKASDTNLARKLSVGAPSDVTFIEHPEWRRATVH